MERQLWREVAELIWSGLHEFEQHCTNLKTVLEAPGEA